MPKSYFEPQNITALADVYTENSDPRWWSACESPRRRPWGFRAPV